MLPYVDTVWALLDRERRKGKRILFEGAQGALLDIDHGTYPFVTSSNTVAAQAATGSGLGPGAINYVLGITKAYTTRVGEGPFPTELKDETGRLLGERGVEFGTVTGRPRRCGWFDACLVRQTRKVGGINGIALTKLDVLDSCRSSRSASATGSTAARSTICRPAQGAQARVEPIYETLEGWTESTEGARSWAELPAQCIKYVRRLEELIERAGGAALDKPEARGHHPRARPLRGLGTARWRTNIPGKWRGSPAPRARSAARWPSGSPPPASTSAPRRGRATSSMRLPPQAKHQAIPGRRAAAVSAQGCVAEERRAS